MNVLGVSDRKVDMRVVALGRESGISRSEISRIWQGLAPEVQAFVNRVDQLDRVDAMYIRRLDEARKRGISRSVIVSVGINATGQREELKIEVGSEDKAYFWIAFLRRLRTQGLSGVRLVISDAHAGLNQAITHCFQGSTWQRCRVLFARSPLAVLSQQVVQLTRGCEVATG